ncbi:GHKL domain-containing protein [Pedobacter sp. MR2016-19]|uniref:sensor histidine kinase n=1 Tax=Pedobacter sp. MR2016-19 TaxID=2780089 RepID=UPI00187660FB|nr:ATP-binding protein [Pedobacter sp. MR2016-19]MBE5319158.1 GHKL domain-containing protein [Pedobacter sp. MR2016-19]
MMTGKRQFGIKLKITAAFSLIFILLSFSFNLYCYRKIRMLMISDNDAYLIARAQTLLDKTEVLPAIIPLPDNNTSIRVLYHSAGKPITVFQSPGIIKNIRTPTKTGVTDTLGMRVAYVISSNEDNPAELILVRSAEQLNNNLQYLLLLLFACSLLSVLLAGLIAYILSFYLLQPVQRIIKAAKLINAHQLRDVIPVKKTNDELQELTETINMMLVRIDESLQQQQNFFASASHELKTPLAIMRAEIEVHLSKPVLAPELSNLMKSQLAEINRLQQVVQEFLLVSQLKSSGITLHKQQIDLSLVILRLFHRFQPFLQQKGLNSTIDFDKDAETFLITADDDKLNILLMNLLENAVKYATPDTTISCSVQQSTLKDHIAISFKNTINEESFPTENLQNAFHREAIDSNGAGIGLWLVKEITHLHDGNFRMESSNFSFEAIVDLPISA